MGGRGGGGRSGGVLYRLRQQRQSQQDQPSRLQEQKQTGEVRQKLMINSDRVSQAVGGGGGGRGRGTPVGKRTLKSNSSLY